MVWYKLGFLAINILIPVLLIGRVDRLEPVLVPLCLAHVWGWSHILSFQRLITQQVLKLYVKYASLNILFSFLVIRIEKELQTRNKIVTRDGVVRVLDASLTLSLFFFIFYFY